VKYIKQITPDEMNEAFRKYFELCCKENRFIDLWDVKGFFAHPNDLCWSSLDGNAFYCIEVESTSFVIFAFDKGDITNVKGIYESLYEAVKVGYPFIRLWGRIGRYRKILRPLIHWQNTSFFEPREGYEELSCYFGHPHNVKVLESRLGIGE
jgi:hypothetical protein